MVAPNLATALTRNTSSAVGSGLAVGMLPPAVTKCPRFSLWLFLCAFGVPPFGLVWEQACDDVREQACDNLLFGWARFLQSMGWGVCASEAEAQGVTVRDAAEAFDKGGRGLGDAAGMDAVCRVLTVNDAMGPCPKHWAIEDAAVRQARSHLTTHRQCSSRAGLAMHAAC